MRSKERVVAHRQGEKLSPLCKDFETGRCSSISFRTMQLCSMVALIVNDCEHSAPVQRSSKTEKVVCYSC